MRRMQHTGTVTVRVPLHDALRLFTPEGERAWVEGWHPRYATTTDDDTAPGTVFTTTADGRTTIWVVVERRTDGYRYARVTPGHTAGMVTVTGSVLDEARTAVEVTYDLSALSASARNTLDALDAGYVTMLLRWEHLLADLDLTP